MTPHEPIHVVTWFVVERPTDSGGTVFVLPTAEDSPAADEDCR